MEESERFEYAFSNELVD